MLETDFPLAGRLAFGENEVHIGLIELLVNEIAVPTQLGKLGKV